MESLLSPLGYGERSSVKRMLLIDALANCVLDQTDLHCDVQPATHSTNASVMTTLDLKTDHNCNQLATTLVIGNRCVNETNEPPGPQKVARTFVGR